MVGVAGVAKLVGPTFGILSSVHSIWSFAGGVGGRREGRAVSEKRRSQRGKHQMERQDKARIASTLVRSVAELIRALAVLLEALDKWSS